MNPKTLLQRWDREALTQLCEANARLAAENDELRSQLANAEDSADFWQEQATSMQDELAETTGKVPGITMSGRLVVVDHVGN